AHAGPLGRLRVEAAALYRYRIFVIIAPLSWRSLSDSSSAHMRSQPCWAKAVWVRCIVRATRSSNVKSRSRFCRKSFLFVGFECVLDPNIGQLFVKIAN